jgi:uncharacterized SAM-binding protein YcdF (DUF218 family)
VDLLAITKTIAALLLPPGGIIVLLLLGMLLYRRHARLSAMLIIVASCALYLLSVSAISGLLMAPLERIAILGVNDSRALDRQAIVVLGGGRRSQALEYGGETVSARTLERIRYGARLHRRLGLPLLVTGGVVFGDGLPEAELMAEALREDFAVPVKWIEGRSRTTQENAKFTRMLLSKSNIDRVLLVSHAAHLPRAIPMFVDQGFDVVAAPTAFSTRVDGDMRVFDWIPSSAALAQSWFAMHEYLGRIWYWLRR